MRSVTVGRFGSTINRGSIISNMHSDTGIYLLTFLETFFNLIYHAKTSKLKPLFNIASSIT